MSNGDPAVGQESSGMGVEEYRYETGVPANAPTSLHRSLAQRASREALSDRAVGIQGLYIQADILEALRAVIFELRELRRSVGPLAAVLADAGQAGAAVAAGVAAVGGGKEDAVVPAPASKGMTARQAQAVEKAKRKGKSKRKPPEAPAG